MGIRISDQGKRWSNGRILFDIDSQDFSTSELNVIMGAVAHWNANTVVKLAGHDGEENFVVFRAVSRATRIDGRLKQVAVGAANLVWGVNDDDEIFRRDGNSWTQITGRLKQISVARDGAVWGVNANDRIFRR